MLGENGQLTKLEVEDNLLVVKDGELKSRGTGHKRILDVETVVFAIGDKVDDLFGLPIASNEFIKNPAPRFPVDGHSYESFDPKTNSTLSDIFVGGWSRQASDGLVGLARKDGINASKAVAQYLNTVQPMSPNLEGVAEKMKTLSRPVITKTEVKKLEAIEEVEAKKRGLEEFKFTTNEEMLQAIGLAVETA
jgi:ferredoxin--NADP+ reductase